MDPLNIMLNREQVVPYYQPILSADTQLVVGYEVMALFREQAGGARSLAWFFNDSSIPDEFCLELNTWIQQKVLDSFINTDQSKRLFFNYHADLLIRDNGETLLSLLETYDAKGLDLSKIVIQIKGAFVTGQLDALRKLVTYTKTLGIQIAVDDAGGENGSLERLALLKPNIANVNLAFLKDDWLPYMYSDMHHSLSMLSRKIGITLLFKGIKTYLQLNYAWRNGGQYYQGSYLKLPDEMFVEDAICRERIQQDFHYFIQFESKKMKAQLKLTNYINAQFKTALEGVSHNAPYDDIIIKVGYSCSRFAFRVYICNDKGVQLSSNAEKNEKGEWELHYEDRQKNWSWRPYFFENIIRMNFEKKGILSDLYTDIAKDEQIRTYAYPLSDQLYIFLDVPYDYLYEQEGLL